MNIATNNQIRMDDPFWGPRLTLNAETAIFHQWEQLEKTGCIENFRLVADKKEGFRLGFFFADSDAFKWLDAAARIYASRPSERLKTLMDDFIALIGKTQTEDGYIYTYNQFHFPEVRWANLQIEHELYCHGHLIEAGVSHFEATGERKLLEIAICAADLIVKDFAAAGPQATPGHEEIELALLRLYEVTQNPNYLNLAEGFIEQRGKIRPFITHILASNKGYTQRTESVTARLAAYQAAHPEHAQKFQLPPDNIAPKPRFGHLRWFLNMAAGKYFQQHQPVRQQTVPVGHAVRFTYLETAIAMLQQHKSDPALLETLENAWDRMVARRMYITGGIGALPNIEGFGRDYELPPEYSYAETCAALGNIFWNWEMTRLTGDAKYADLTEWQLYNAAAVGLGQDGASYAYNNPLASQTGLTRPAWFKCPCCPSNITRTWANLGKYVASVAGDGLWVHQYIGSQVIGDKGLGIRVQSEFPWGGKVQITVESDEPKALALHLRIPSWCDTFEIKVNGTPIEVKPNAQSAHHPSPTASGYDPRRSFYLPIERVWSRGDEIELEFEMPVQIWATHPKVKATRGKVAISRGPLVYCLESSDNPGIDIFNVQLDPSSLYAQFDPDFFGGATLIRAQTTNHQPLTLIPYFLWANRGNSQMTVYTKV